MTDWTQGSEQHWGSGGGWGPGAGFAGSWHAAPSAGTDGSMVETTGRLLVLTDVRMSKTGKPTSASLGQVEGLFSDTVGVSLAHSSEFSDDDAGASEALGAVEGSSGVFLDELGVAIIESNEDWQERLTVAAADPDTSILQAEPERVVWAMSDFVAGYRAGVNDLADAIDAHPGAGLTGAGIAGMAGGPFADDATFTWGLKAIGVPGASGSGAGSRVAVLDTGADLTHPDLAPAIVATRSFVAGETVEDGNGHGSHCCGTVAGRRSPAGVPRFGVAPDAELFVGKVLSNAGRGGDGGILSGILWAIRNGCEVISMSLGADVPAGTPYSRVFERAAQRALANGTIIIAAAGNASRRPQFTAPIGHPANCPSILSVAAVDQRLAPASFSSAGRVGDDQINLSGPGVAVLSSVPGGGHRAFSGTSMATPHVAGAAAVLRGTADVVGPELALRLLLTIQGLAAPAVDVGAGLCSVADR